MDDFFSAAPSLPSIDAVDDNTDTFAQAIAGHFNQSGRGPMLTARLDPTVTITNGPLVDSPMPEMSGNSPTPKAPRLNIGVSVAGPSSKSPVSRFTAATAATLPDILSTPHLLIIDIRPPSAYATARLPCALSLSVPSTLLKRPAFTLSKLGNMLSSAAARARFSAWNTASRILVYDADTTSLQDGSNVLGLLRKFQMEGFKGDISWLQGGIQALWRDYRHFVDQGALSEDEDDAEEDNSLRARDLPKAAFQQSTTNALHSAPLTVKPSLPLQKEKRPPLTQRTAANPFYDNIRQNIELSHGITERIPLKLPSTVRARQDDLPFKWLRNIAGAADLEEGTEALAMQFYRIELGEQRRLQGVMAHHSQQTEDETSADNSQSFPFSIIAGVEKGSKNRYRNIWPFEHARVRLQRHSSDVHHLDDYVNASYVQPLGTKRRYIATQGPLASTFNDFWTLVWEQNVRVVVMLTKEIEGAVAKCGNYWQEGNYGPLRLKLVSSSITAEENNDTRDKGFGSGSTSGFDFYVPTSGHGTGTGQSQEDKDKEDTTIKRTFKLSHTKHPEVPPRTVTQLQYLGWPDMNVPETPKGLLNLIKEVHEVADSGENGGLEEGVSPVLLHCSAGVGRTGGYIMVDAILDGVRREIRKRNAEKDNLTTKRDIAIASGNTTSSDSAEMDWGVRRMGGGGVDLPSYGDSSPVMMDVDTRYVAREESPPIHPIPATRSTSSPKSPTGLVAPLLVGGKPPVSSPVAHHTKGHGDGGLVVHVPVVPSNEQHSELPPFAIKTGTSRSGSDSKGSSTAKTSSLPRSTGRLHPSTAESTAVPALTSSASVNPSTSSGSTDFTSSPESGVGVGDNGSANNAITDAFTIADADSMFITEATPHSVFAMDVEPQQQAYRDSVVRIETDTDAEGKTDVDPFGLRNGRGMSKMSSSDERSAEQWKTSSDSDSYALPSGSGSASGGGYSSSSSLGLRAFNGLSTYASPAPFPALGHVPVPAHVTPHPTAQQVPSPSKRRLLAPSSLPAPMMHPMPAVAAMKDKSRSADVPVVNSNSVANRIQPPRVKSQDSRSSSFTHPIHVSTSSSSLPTTDTSSSLLSDHYASSATAMSVVSDTPPEKAKSSSSSTGTFDYTAPRELHRRDSPPALSTLKEPVRQVLEDMREQRMSLCQSLRQYVFVHRAIIEGALEIVDEEVRGRSSAKDVSEAEPASTMTSNYNAFASAVSFSDFPLQMHGKRGASPTELPKESRRGKVMLSKRPSIKRGASESSNNSSSPNAYPDSP